MWHWLFLATGIFLCYLITLYAVPNFSKPGPEPLDHPPCKTHFGRNALIAVIAFFLFDAAVFHSGLYNLIIAPTSAAGTVVLQVEQESQRKPSQEKEILVLGDSRLYQGFSPKLADQLTFGKGFKFISVTLQASGPRLWFFLLREIDPSTRRYYAIVIPRVFDGLHALGNVADKPRDIPMAAPLLRYTDAYSFSSSFREQADQYRAFIACLLRGSAFQLDFFDLLQHPAKRRKSAREHAAIMQARYEYVGKPDDVVGLSYDPARKRLSFPPDLPLPQRDAIEQSLLPLQQGRNQPQPRRDWTDKILRRYANSPTLLISLPLPRGPLGPLARPTGYSQTVAEELMSKRRAVVLEDGLFNFIEAPEFFFDGFHPNARGRQKITECLVNELLERLDSPAHTAAPAVSRP